MITKVYPIVSYLIILLGVVHICFAFPIEDFDTYILYFIGSGVAIILIGLINLIRIKTPTNFVRTICTALNLVIMILSVLALFALQEPQVFIAIALFGSSFFLSLKKD